MLNNKTNFEKALISSTVLHIVVMFIFIFEIPSIFEPKITEENVLTFEVLPVTDINNIETQEKSLEKLDESDEEKYKKLESHDNPQEVKPIEEEAKEEIPETKEIVPEEEKKIKPKKEEQPKEEVQKDLDPFEQALKNIDPKSLGDEEEAKKKTDRARKISKRKSFGKNFHKNAPLSITEKNLIKNQIQRKWRKPVGSKNIEQVRIYLRMFIEKDGTIKDYWVHKKKCPPDSGNTCKIAEKSIMRAVKKASPLKNLPSSRYDSWKETEIVLSPSSF